ncbi:SWI/SNF-related matrix-associated actin-dependent regulator of chromatin subfamily A containing DEAD/H box 1 isoform X2 [Nematostella vectensis]|uniref:SWI/SNF-related matrix-associated actin-dependent regulator of chromatin subfamily A containing DEAD/H box 1 isoform X2 n=1 Tax=Nematostella vectensis TaxID=45351 RepID=UPI002076FBE0|nr:SWI/SNF-related matrix-associated actin-dependent regulator of chromatin subfamily A containing DEAD/H box 1 isoform X2 [Nematostella vectensis]
MFERFSYQKRTPPKVNTSKSRIEEKEEGCRDDSSPKLSLDSWINSVASSGEENDDKYDSDSMDSSTRGETDHQRGNRTSKTCHWFKSKSKGLAIEISDSNSSCSAQSENSTPGDLDEVNSHGSVELFPDGSSEDAENSNVSLTDAFHSVLNGFKESMPKDDEYESPLVAKKARRKRVISLDSDSDMVDTPKKKHKSSTLEEPDFLCNDGLSSKSSSVISVHSKNEKIDLAKLRELFPDQSEEQILQIYQDAGSLDHAVDLLVASAASSGPSSHHSGPSIKASSAISSKVSNSRGSRASKAKKGPETCLGTYPGDADSAVDDDNLPADRKAAILSFFQTCSLSELSTIPECSRKKAQKILSLKPFKSWHNMVNKLESTKGLTSQILWNCDLLLKERTSVDKLMQNCNKISLKIQELLLERMDNNRDPNDSHATISGLVTQPDILNPSRQLKPYQLTGLNWLILMHEQGVNGILADEMGLGKTVQAISFIAHLIEKGDDGPHLIIVPSSTLNNWVKEFKQWCPTIRFTLYYGSQEERTYLREEILDEHSDFKVIITTYNMATGGFEDTSFLRQLRPHYVVFDEGHMLKNMQSQRYLKLTRIRAKRRLLLTGTPMQNDLLELMSLLSFVMPTIFDGRTDGLKLLFGNKKLDRDADSGYIKERAEQAKKIMKPFVLRRLKKDVLQELPQKHEHVIHCELSTSQKDLHSKLMLKCYNEYRDAKGSNQYKNILMALRMMSNHPLLLRNYYKDETLREMAVKYCRDIENRGSEVDLVCEDMTVMSDFELHRLCLEQRSLSSYVLGEELLYDSGKFERLNAMLPEMKDNGDRVLLFSQFTLVMDIIEVYLQHCGYRYFRLDGQTPVVERQPMIDNFNSDPDIFLFLLSTKAGGLGINLTSANVVILHDIDFNPYNDKQAEDRCHRVGQTRDVHVYRLIAKDTVEDNMLKCANSKLKLEKDVVSADNDEDSGDSSEDVASVLTNVFKRLRDSS